MLVKIQFRKIIEGILEIIYPNFCILCNDTLGFLDPRGICRKCEEKHGYLENEICIICGKPLNDKKYERCFDCRKVIHFYKEGRSMFVYEASIKEAIYEYKYNKKKEYGYLFAKELIRYYNNSKDWQIDIVIPVPLYEVRLKERGYNQSEIIAKYFARHYEIALETKALWRIKGTKPQKLLNDQERKRNVRSAFKANKECVRGKQILLIDDIYTTGSTIDACAKALIDEGAKEIYYLALSIGRGL